MLPKAFRLLLIAGLCLCSALFVDTSLANFSPAAKLYSVAECSEPLLPAQSLPQGTLLRTGETLRREIARDQRDIFHIDLTEDQYAEVVFQWQGIDLNVAVYDSDNNRTLPSDVLVFPPGPVSVSLLAGTVGRYRLEVTSPVKQKVKGSYNVTLTLIRPQIIADSSRLSAQKLVAEGRVLKSPLESIIKYEQSLAHWQLAHDVDGEAQTLMLLGDLYRLTNDHTKAKRNYEAAARLWSAKSYVRGDAYANLSIGNLTRSLGNANDALRFYDTARLLFSQVGDRRGEASALYGEAFTYMSIGRTPEALQPLHSALEIRSADGDRLGQANIMNMMADAYRLLGDPEKSLTLYDQTLEVLRDLEYRSLDANVINGRVLVFDDLGDWQRAQEGYRYAISLYESLLGEQGFGLCTARTSAQEMNICRLAASAIDNLGETYNSLGNPERAMVELKRSLVIRDALAQPRGQGSTRYHLAYTRFLQGDIAGAIELYQNALEFQQKAGDEKGVALTLTYLGMAYAARNQPRLAMKQYQRAKALLQASGDKRAQAITLDKLAAVQGLLGDFSEASKNYAFALDLWRSIKDADGESLTLYHMAADELSAGDLDSSVKHSQLATTLVESLRTLLSSQKARTSYLADKANYYELNIHLQMLLSQREGNRHLISAFESSEKAKARVLLDTLSEAGFGKVVFNPEPKSLWASVVLERVSLVQRLGNKAQARTRLLNSEHTPQQVALIDKDIAVITEKLDEVEAKIRTEKPSFAALTKPKPSTLPEIQQQLDNETLLLEYALGQKRSYVWAVTPNSIDGFELPARDQIESVARRVTNALTARNRQEKNETWSQRQARIVKAEKDYSEASAALSKIVIEPVASLLGKKRLVVVADGALQMIPFAALPLPESSTAAQKTMPRAESLNARSVAAATRLLISEHEIISLPSASVLALQRRELANRKTAPYAVAVLADPVFDFQDARVAKATGRGNQPGKNVTATGQGGDEKKENKFELSTSPSATRPNAALASALRDIGLTEDGKLPRLTHSLQEARAIARAVPADQSFTALGFKASRETANSQQLSKYRIIHFATHGVLNLEHPELSGIVLSLVDERGQPQDGYLRLHDIYNLNLPAELVVLSACQTGIGKQIKGEGLMALTRGFMYAGAKSVVASLWKVDDAATSALMAEFYKQMFSNKLKPAAALREAQRNLARQKRWQSPYYWAGFFLQGDWN